MQREVAGLVGVTQASLHWHFKRWPELKSTLGDSNRRFYTWDQINLLQAIIHPLQELDSEDVSTVMDLMIEYELIKFTESKVADKLGMGVKQAKAILDDLVLEGELIRTDDSMYMREHDGVPTPKLKTKMRR